VKTTTKVRAAAIPNWPSPSMHACIGTMVATTIAAAGACR
jgi:hypothetical protein